MTSPALDTTGMADARAIYREARRFYAPAVRLPIVPWIEREWIVTKGSGAAQPGPYRFAQAPWWREVAGALADETTQQIVIAKSSQVGYTELFMAYLGWCMDQDPSSILVIQPTVELAESWSKERIEPVIREVPAVARAMKGQTKGMARSSDDTLRRKVFPGGYLAIMGSNSPRGLASRPIRRVIGDERDGWPVSAGSEGDPMELARRRTTTFWNRKIIEGGTPLEEDGSPTWSKWQASDMRQWHVPCPHCGTFQPLKWRDDTGAYHIVVDRDPETGRIIPESAQYRCAECQCLIDERHKAAMVGAGRWVAEYPGRPIRGYHMWSAYSPWVTWAEIITDFDDARGAEARLKTFVNTILGLPFAAAAEKIDPSKLLARAESMTEPPSEVGLLTAGVDVQADRVEYVVKGWGESERACTLEYGIVEGDPSQPETWDELTRELTRPRGDLRIQAVAADTGYRPEVVWRWADGRLPFRVFCTKGMPGRGKLLMQKPGAVTHKRKRRPWLVGVDTAKDHLSARLRSAPDGPQGERFADTLPPEFYDHLTSEKLVTEYVGSQPVRKWKLMDGRRNEGLDCAILAHAALYALGVPTVQRLGAMARARAEKRQQMSQNAHQTSQDTQPTARPRTPARRGGWVNNWKG